MPEDTTHNLVRIVGSNTWVGVDVQNKELMMERDGVITVLADFRSVAAAEMVDVFLVTLAKMAPPIKRGWFR